MSENSISDKFAGQIQTNGLESVSVLSYNIPLNCSEDVTISVVARDPDNGDTYVCEQKFALKRGSSSGKIVGEIIYSLPVQSDLSMETADVSVTVSGASLNISVSGVLTKTIDWWCSLDAVGIQEA